MVIDTSALLAILLHESEAQQFAEAIGRTSPRLVSVLSVLEASIVMRSRKGDAGVVALDELLETIEATVVEFTSEQLAIARSAYRKFGKGRHPAALNLGDCCTYALAQSSEEPLLCKGNDFSKSDLPLWHGVQPDS